MLPHDGVRGPLEAEPYVVCLDDDVKRRYRIGRAGGSKRELSGRAGGSKAELVIAHDVRIHTRAQAQQARLLRGPPEPGELQRVRRDDPHFRRQDPWIHSPQYEHIGRVRTG